MSHHGGRRRIVEEPFDVFVECVEAVAKVEHLKSQKYAK